jgi:hypothetical protein
LADTGRAVQDRPEDVGQTDHRLSRAAAGDTIEDSTMIGSELKCASARITFQSAMHHPVLSLLPIR